MNPYNHKNIEQKWQKDWEEKGIYNVADEVTGKENYMALVEFSYPSGNLHVGHWYAFAVPDIFARYKRMQGYNVMYPMGFDAFGLPAENAAIKLGRDPKVWTYEHMETMRNQLRSMGAMFDWSREVVSCDPAYYKWTQWMFTEFLKNDLAYRAMTKVNWCPKDMTVLANEQVHDGKCERCGSEVIQKDQAQWMLRITKYADELIDDLKELNWPEEIKSAQKNWIGRSEGSEIDFKIKDSEGKITVFTTRADTLFGVTYVVLAPEHPLIEALALSAKNQADIFAYIDESKKKSELDRQQNKEKTGVKIEGVFAINPANGEEVPVWIADYVLAGYGTGAVMAVPAHDERDFEFAKKYNLRKINVIEPMVSETSVIVDLSKNSEQDALEKSKLNHNLYLQGGFCYTNISALCKLRNSQQFNDLHPNEARTKITEFVGGKLVKTYRLRDWGISRQRYWGVPIPIVYDPEGEAHPIPKEHLPWLLPTDVDHTPDGTSPLARSKELFERTEKIFGAGWKPEVETMDTFVDSSWYFYRYLDPKNTEAFCDKEKMNKWLPIDLYMGGAEHTTMHVLYSRFWTKALKDIGLVNNAEEFTIRRNRGLILGPDGNKMSKSKGNVIDPDEIVQLLGADTVRMYLAFMGPYGVTVNYPWDPNGVVGVRRFLERVWRLKEKTGDTSSSVSIKTLHKTIKKVSDDVLEYKFNTAISAMMILTNVWEKESVVAVSDYKILLQLLSPFAPHMTEELWHELGETESIHLSTWPKYDESLTQDDEITVVVQINGKVRAELLVPVDIEETEVIKLATTNEKILPWIDGKEIKKTIYVKGKLVSIVI